MTDDITEERNALRSAVTQVAVVRGNLDKIDVYAREAEAILVAGLPCEDAIDLVLRRMALKTCRRDATCICFGISRSTKYCELVVQIKDGHVVSHGLR